MMRAGLAALIRAGIAALAVSCALPAAAGDISVTDAYARASTPLSQSGAAFMQITNHGPDDRLVGVRSDAARKSELHTHEIKDGIARMIQVHEGFAVASGQSIVLERGGRHVMLMGLTRPFVDGEEITLRLDFEEAGEVIVDVPVKMGP